MHVNKMPELFARVRECGRPHLHDAAVGADGAQQMGETKDFDGAAMPNVVGTEGDAARLSLSLYGITYIMPVSEDGSETPLVAHDTLISAANGGSSGFMSMDESKDFDGAAFPNVVGTEGDAVRPASSLYGVRYVMLVNEDGSAVGTILISSEYLDDSGYTVTTDYVGAVGYMADTALVDSVEEDDIGIPRMSLNRVPLGMIWDAGGNERGANVTAGNAVEMDVAEQSLTALKVSKDANANSATNPIIVQPSDGTAVNAQGNPLYSVVSKDTSANALGNPILVQLSDGTNAFLTTTTYPGYLRLQDGTGTTLGYVATATAAGLSKSENGLKTESVIYLDNGATLDPATSGATGELNTTDVAVRPGENAGLFAREVKVAYLGITEPAMQGPTAVDDTAISATTGTIIFSSTKVLPSGRYCVYVKNDGGGTGNAFSDVEIHDSPDGTSGWVITNTWTSCDTLVAGAALCKYCDDFATGWIVIKARCAATEDTTAKAWLVQVKR